MVHAVYKAGSIGEWRPAFLGDLAKKSIKKAILSIVGFCGFCETAGVALLYVSVASANINFDEFIASFVPPAFHLLSERGQNILKPHEASTTFKRS